GDPELVEYAIDEKLRGGFGVALFAVRDFQLMTFAHRISVPWDDRELSFEFGSFRDRIRPGARERFTVTVRSASGEPLDARAAEVLAYMYDRSLDVFAPHAPSSPLSLYPDHARARVPAASLGSVGFQAFLGDMLSQAQPLVAHS